MLLFPASNDLLTLFVALEVLSLPLYLMAGLARRRRLLSQEAALKYFLLGAFSSAFFLFGLAFVYGFAGSLGLGEIAVAVSSVPGLDPLLLAGIALVAVGLLFKVSAVPVPRSGPPTSTKAHRRRSPASWPRAPRSRPLVPCCASSTWPSAAFAGTGGR